MPYLKVPCVPKEVPSVDIPDRYLRKAGRQARGTSRRYKTTSLRYLEASWIPAVGTPRQAGRQGTPIGYLNSLWVPKVGTWRYLKWVPAVGTPRQAGYLNWVP